MTKFEVAEMLNFAQACYPEAKFKDQRKVLEVWAEMFAEHDAKTTMECLKRACRTGKYFPSVASVMSEVMAEREKMRGYVEC